MSKSIKSPLLTKNEVIHNRGIVLIKIPRTGSQSFLRTIVCSCVNKKVENYHRYRLEEVFDQTMSLKLWSDLHNRPEMKGVLRWDKMRKAGHNLLLDSPTAWDVGGQLFRERQLEIIGDKKYKILMSHWPWSYKPDIYRRIMVSDNPVTITLLREPAKRVLSLYFYNFRRDADLTKANLDDFEAYLDFYDSNYYARWLSYPSTKIDFSTAKKNLEEKITLVGITERFNDFVDLCHKKINLGQYYSHVNKIDSPFTLDDLPERVKKKLYKKTEEDYELYQIARKRFEKDFNS